MAIPDDDRKQSAIGFDPRLKLGIDAGEALAGFEFTGAAPDLGAIEAGAELPHYGPRPRPK